jgi:hypothetical protein
LFRRIELDAVPGTGELIRKVLSFPNASGQLACNVSDSYPHRAVSVEIA